MSTVTANKTEIMKITLRENSIFFVKTREKTPVRKIPVLQYVRYAFLKEKNMVFAGYCYGDCDWCGSPATSKVANGIPVSSRDYSQAKS